MPPKAERGFWLLDAQRSGQYCPTWGGLAHFVDGFVIIIWVTLALIGGGVLGSGPLWPATPVRNDDEHIRLSIRRLESHCRSTRRLINVLIIFFIWEATS